MDGTSQGLAKESGSGSAYPYGPQLSTAPIQPIPFSLYRKPVSIDDDSVQDRPSNIQSPNSNRSSRPPTSQGSEMSWHSNSNGSTMSISSYDKLNKGDVGYGGNVFTGSPDGKQVVAESLLAKKLRDLGVGLQNQQDHLSGV